MRSIGISLLFRKFLILEFGHDTGIGFKDKRGVAVDLSYRHFSNAGLWPPNYGRNFIVMRLTVPWNVVF